MNLEDALALADALCEEHTQTCAQKFCDAKNPDEPMPLSSVRGRRLSCDIASPIDSPPFNRSPLDGFAFMHGDTCYARPENPAVFDITETVYAGQVPAVPLSRGKAARVMTGAMLPEGADCVIRQEDVRLAPNGSVVDIFVPLKQNENVIFRGEDVRSGHIVLCEGTFLGYAEIALLASLGIARVPVRALPQVALFSSGDELVDSNDALPRGKIFDSNKALFSARLADFGITPIITDTLADDEAEITARLKNAASLCDLIITTGGVSVGEKDLFCAVQEATSSPRFISRLNHKPGAAFLLWMLDGTLVLSLSGNPFAAFVNFELIGRALLHKLSGGTVPLPRRIEGVRMESSFEKASPSRRFLRGIFDRDSCSVRLPDNHGMGSLSSLCGCNCLVDIPADSPALAAPCPVDIFLL